ncbi:LOW QUALITY PROTEIN: alpha-amylase [Elysia marginata]|uniref:alpha-amylase n=1 Tax=Elysia marginata TaxID=1093978 RepID=A0AAV4GZR2_9GAST|nr:LOW QUALITY PROTEIN: alpha-amylase [Elysia marginata]
MGLLTIGLMLCGLVSAATGFYTDPHCEKRAVGIVHLFEWKWTDIEKECPRLAQLGFCGVQTSVPTEHLVRPENSWEERYLPVSYDVVSRSGDEDQFINMVKACSATGVRIFVTLQLDHMSPESGLGFNGTPYNASTLDYPGVPYNASHFHTKADCSKPNLSPSSAPKDMQDCWALRYPDLDQSKPHVRDQIVKLLNKFVSMEVAGFFLANSLHIDPKDLQVIFDQVHDVKFGGRPFVTYEMVNTVPSSIDPRWFYPIGRVTDFSMSEVLGKAILEKDLSGLCLLLDSSTVLISRDYATVLPAEQAVVFVDNVDYQRGMSPPWVKVVTYKEPHLYELALSFVFASGYGIPRVMSSYNFTKPSQGPPTDDEGNILGVTQSAGHDCENGWICEHRFPNVKDMVKFSSTFRHQRINNCKAEKTKVSFSRGEEGHFWATLGTLDELRDDLPKVMKWNATSNEYIEELRTEGLTLMNLGGTATVAIYSGSLAPITLREEKKTTTPTTESTTTLPTTRKSTTTLPTTRKSTTTLPTTRKSTATLPTTRKSTTTSDNHETYNYFNNNRKTNNDFT